jgi:hypothetical protein
VAAAIDGGGDGGGGGDEAFAPRSTAAHVLLECSACRQFPCPGGRGREDMLLWRRPSTAAATAAAAATKRSHHAARPRMCCLNALPADSSPALCLRSSHAG